MSVTELALEFLACADDAGSRIEDTAKALALAAGKAGAMAKLSLETIMTDVEVGHEEALRSQN